MAYFLTVIAIMCICAYLSQHGTRLRGLFYWAVVVAYTVFVGLRTSYNDTTAYMLSFLGMEPLRDFLSNPERMNVLRNPLFYGFASWLHGITDNYHVYFVLVAALDSTLLIRFIRKHSYGHFAFAILVFWGYGVGMFGAAAMKQITAMAILTLSLDALMERKRFWFVFTVLIASLIHTYAILFLILPFFRGKPWNWRTMLLALLTGIVLYSFDTILVMVIEYVHDLGKWVSASEVFDGHGMNLLRVAVFALPPVLLFVFRQRLIPQMDEELYLLANMTIITLMFALIGSIQGANMFGRLATYFILGDICILGWIIEKLFTKESQAIMFPLAFLLFLVFFWYDNWNEYYTSISLLDFVRTLF